MDISIKLLEKINLWRSHVTPFEDFDERLRQKSLWIQELNEGDLKRLGKLLSISPHELSKLGVEDVEDFQFEVSGIFGKVGRKFPDQSVLILNKLLRNDFSRTAVFDSIGEIKSAKLFPVLNKALKDYTLNEEELLRLVAALGETPGIQSLELLKKMKNMEELPKSMNRELNLAIENWQNIN